MEKQNVATKDMLLLIVAEYNALRAEILKRVEFPYSLFAINIAALGSVLTISFGIAHPVPTFLLFYPLLSFLLAMGSVYNDSIIPNIARYIRENIEPELPRRGWETHLKKHNPKVGWKGSVVFHIFPLFSFLGPTLFVLVLALFILGLPHYMPFPTSPLEVVKSVLWPVDILLVILMCKFIEDRMNTMR